VETTPLSTRGLKCRGEAKENEIKIKKGNT
jgi:hypothetical protein